MHIFGILLTIVLSANSELISENDPYLEDHLNISTFAFPYISYNISALPVNIPVIKPTPVVTTKVLNIVTKYISRGPICIKASKSKRPCKGVTRNGINNNKKKHKRDIFGTNNNYHSFDTLIEGSEVSKKFNPLSKTPMLKNSSKVTELLIEDRLDHLEDILPHYTRSRVYQTKAITLTRQLLSDNTMATLVVKNCIPINVPICPKKKN